ncbi:hypothetical protein TSAR_009553 [Trichomalopsis sarcophagae]|uniref:Uncharacterized protein n=1 Tax=Trichomalopsis sarcophagae TaxID=543379 RepID=A0A232EPP5_9HYME|nr:hypothetical protein TSAR_009553 [Trichomalopsis sarcophagae]
MTVLCPHYDPAIGWYVIVVGHDGPKKRMIMSPLHYYKKMGVVPPVGAVFTDADFIGLEDDSFDEESNILDPNSLPIPSSDVYALPSVTKVSPKPSVASIIPEAGFSTDTTDNIFMPEVSDSPQYAPNIPEVGVPKSLLNFANAPSHHAGLTPEFMLANVSETDEPTSMYSQEFSSFFYNHQTTTSSIEPQPSTSNAVHDIYTPSNSSLAKSLMSLSYDNYDEDDDYNMKRA